MPHVISYLDYRQFLRDCYEERKQMDAYFSYRYLAARTGMDPSYITKLFQEKVHLSEKGIDAVCQVFKLTKKDRDYFEVLVAFNKSKNAEQSRALFEKLNHFRAVRSANLKGPQYEYYQKWYHAAIRAYIGTGRFHGDFDSLAKHLTPSISSAEALHSVNLLQELNLISVRNGTYAVTDQFITPSPQWKVQAVRAHQKDMSDLAKMALDNCPKELRDMSTLTISLTESDLAEIRERLREFRQSLLAMLEQTTQADRIYQINLQVFPLAIIPKGKNEN